MGIVNIDDDLHEQIRKASTVSSRSINAQAAFWMAASNAAAVAAKSSLKT